MRVRIRSILANLQAIQKIGLFILHVPAQGAAVLNPSPSERV